MTAVHKANIMKLTDGLFIESVRRVASEFPDIEFSECISIFNMELNVHGNSNQNNTQNERYPPTPCLKNSSDTDELINMKARFASIIPAGAPA